MPSSRHTPTRRRRPATPRSSSTSRRSRRRTASRSACPEGARRSRSPSGSACPGRSSPTPARASRSRNGRSRTRWPRSVRPRARRATRSGVPGPPRRAPRTRCGPPRRSAAAPGASARRQSVTRATRRSDWWPACVTRWARSVGRSNGRRSPRRRSTMLRGDSTNASGSCRRRRPSLRSRRRLRRRPGSGGSATVPGAGPAAGRVG